MEVSYNQTAGDYWAFYRYLVPRVVRLGMLFFVLMALPFLIVGLLGAIVRPGFHLFGLQFLLIGLLGDVAAYWLIRRRVLVLARRMPGFVGKYTVNISEKGITITAPQGNRKWPWSEVQSMGKSRRYLFLLIGKDSACIIPRQAFGEAAVEAQFLAQLQGFRSAQGKRT